MKMQGLHITDARGEHTIRVRALHLHEVQGLVRKPVDIGLVCSNSYDTEWLATMVRPYLSPDGYLVSIQNGMNEECLAKVVGPERVVGCIASTISVNLKSPGRIVRFKAAASDGHAVFRVGEPDGSMSGRIIALAALLNQVDSASVTRNLTGERWTKLVANTITHGLLGATGLTNRAVFIERGKVHRLGLKLAAEAVAVGRAHGYEMGPILGIAPAEWLAAGSGDRAAIERVQDGLENWSKGFTEFSRSSVGRDVEKGRRTEVDFTNGLVATKGREAGVPAPTHAALTEIVRRIDRGELKAHPDNIKDVPG
jgi:2-dehydropantoate 2-reductase